MLARIWIIVLLTSFYACQTETDSTANPEHIMMAQQFMTALTQGQFVGASLTLAPSLTASMSPEKLGSTFADIESVHGIFQRMHGVRASTIDKWNVVYLRSAHEKAGKTKDIDLRLVFDKSNRIEGLWFRPTDLHKMYSPL
jgi:hypothetical protein